MDSHAGVRTYAAPPPLRNNHLVPRIGRQGRFSIDIFPNELLIKIFADVEPTRRLMAVCQRWRVVICATPEFWRDIHVCRHLEWLNLCLQRSKQLLVDVTFSWPETVVNHAYRCLHPHRSRIASLDFQELDCAQPEIANRTLLVPQMPRLKRFRIRVKHTRHSADAPVHQEICSALFPMSPGLEELRVSGMRVLGRRQEFSSLRRLFLEENGPPVTQTITEFIHFLNACTSLEELSLQRNALEAVSFEVPEGTEGHQASIVLPRLRDLSITGRIEDISDLLSYMDVRDDVSIWLETDEQQDVESASTAPMDILPSDVSGCKLGILKSATRIMVDIPLDSPYELAHITAIRGTNVNHKINIMVQGAQPQGRWQDDGPLTSPEAKATYFNDALHFLPQMFPNAPVDTLVCRGDLEAINDEVWERLFAGFPMLKTLVVDDRVRVGDPTRLFRKLSCPPSPGDSHPVCGNLEHIWVCNALGSPDSLEEIRKCIAWRSENGAPLKRLCLELFADDIEQASPAVSVYTAEFARLVPDSSVRIVDVKRGLRFVQFYGTDITEEFPFW